ncbi:MAG: DUF6382 domain-containing protein [Sarcina sp.]
MNIKEDVKNNMLELSVKSSDILDYQIGMINKNRGLKIIEIDKSMVNGECLLNFDLKKKISLEKYFEQDRFKKEKILEIILKIARIIIKSSDYLLNKKNFFLDPKYIYYENEDIYLIYIPINEDVNKNINIEFSNFIKIIIVDLIIFYDLYEKDGFIGSLLNLTKQKEVSIKEFIVKIEMMLNLKGEDELENNIEFKIPPILESDLVEEVSITQTNKSKHHYRDSINLDFVQADEIEIQKPSEYAWWLKYGIGILQVFAVGLVLLLVINGTSTSVLIIISLLVILLDILVVRFLLQPKEVIQEMCLTNMQEKFRVEKMEQEEVEKGFINIGKKEIVSQNAYQTSMTDKSKPYFLLINEGITERVYVTKDIFVIGRYGEECDYVINNNTVGKRHLKITKVNKEIYVEDMNSKNGSYINGKKIKVGKLYKVEENFKIKISNVSLIFKEV